MRFPTRGAAAVWTSSALVSVHEACLRCNEIESGIPLLRPFGKEETDRFRAFLTGALVGIQGIWDLSIFFQTNHKVTRRHRNDVLGLL